MKTLPSLFSAFCLLLLASGCAALKPSTDRALFQIQTNYEPHVIIQTNTVRITNNVEVPIVIKEVVVVTNFVGVPVLVTNVQREIILVTNTVAGETVTVTNTIERTAIVTNTVPGDPVIVQTIVEHTNIVTVPEIHWSTNTVTVTNLVPHDVVVTPRESVVKGIEIGGALTGPWGTFAAVGLTALLAAWARQRQKAANDVLQGKVEEHSTVNAVFAQSIEVARELLKNTPQGAELENRYRAWLKNHQAVTDVLGAASVIVAENVNNQQAKDIAALLAPPPTQPPNQ